MKKQLFAVGMIALIPFVSSANFDQNLKYGMTGPAVTELQDLLVEGGYLHVNPTGFFGLLTLNAVKEFQTANSLPSTGYFGVLSRGVANTMVTNATANSTQAEVEETGTTTPVVTTTPVQVSNPASTAVVQAVPNTFTPKVYREQSSPEKPTFMRKTALEYSDSYLGVTPLVCTTKNPRNPGVLLYEHGIIADWGKTQSVVITYSDNNYQGGDRYDINSSESALLSPRQFSGGKLNYVIRSYDSIVKDPNAEQYTKRAEGTITEPSCN